MHQHTIIVKHQGASDVVFDENTPHSVAEDAVIDRVNNLMGQTPEYEEASYFVDGKLWYYVHRSYLQYKHN